MLEKGLFQILKCGPTFTESSVNGALVTVYIFLQTMTINPFMKPFMKMAREKSYTEIFPFL